MLCLLVASLLATLPRSLSVEDQLFTYFNDNITTTGLVLDRASDKTRVSVAATGFGMYSWAIGFKQERISHGDALAKVKQAFRATLKNNPLRNRGFLSHFITIDGLAYKDSEVSTIDSAIFYLGALRAAELLDNKEFINEVKLTIAKVDTSWMMVGPYIRHGYFWDDDKVRFINVVWDNYSEGIIIYRLFNLPYQPKETKYTLSLFAYYYPLCFFDEPLMVNNLKLAIASQQEIYNCFALTAGDTENHGYQDFDKDTVSPLVEWSLTKYLKLPEVPQAPKLKIKDAPTISFPADSLDKQCVLSRNRLTGWEGRDRISIEMGANFILLWKANKTSEQKCTTIREVFRDSVGQ